MLQKVRKQGGKHSIAIKHKKQGGKHALASIDQSS